MGTARTSVDSVPAHPFSADDRGNVTQEPGGIAGHRSDYIRMGLVAAAIILSRFHWPPLVAGVDVLGIAAALIGGYPVFREAIRDTLGRRMTMELSMTIALVAALSIRQVFTADVIILFVLFAELIEEMTMHRGHQAVSGLIVGLPDTAELVSGNNWNATGAVTVVATSSLKPGDVVLVRPGMLIPVDGKVSEGNSFADQSAITGELDPVEVSKGSTVYAGSVNHSGALQVRTDSLGTQTVYSRMLDALIRAGESRAPVQKLADRLAGYLVYFALACALVTLLVTRDAQSTISVIIVAGACGIAAGTPLAILGGLGRAARIGAIVKGGAWLEKLGTVDTVVFDKTGTLTLGHAEVVDLEPTRGVSPTELLRVAACAEASSEHPLARAVMRRASSLPVHPAKEFAYHPGRGVTGLVDNKFTVLGSRAFVRSMGVPFTQPSPHVEALSEIAVAQAGRLLGLIFIADIVRTGAAKAMARLRALELHLVLMTGDATAIATALGRSLQFDRIEANLLPDAKLAKLRELKAEGRCVAMIGDGVNDAPAFAAADVPVAMGSGTEIAQRFAGVLLIGDDLGKLADLVELARRCRGIILFNFVGTLAIDAVGMGLAAFGLLTPILAALVHVGSELFFILNSARLLPLRHSARS